MNTRNWKVFTRRITINASLKSIYDAWATQQGLESWFLRLAQFTKADGTLRPKNSPVEKDDTYKWLWHGYNDSVAEEAKILSANGWDQLSFEFSGRCIVSVSIKSEENENICELRQEMPMEDIQQQQYYYIECGNGWTFYLANLKSVLEGGLDLRNKNPLITAVVNA